MKKGLMAKLRWRSVRWFALAAAAPALWACTSRKLVAPEPDPAKVEQKRIAQSVNRKIDLLFVIDDSKSMAPLQAKMVQRLPDFMNVLRMLQGGLPDMHVAVVTSSMGAGIYSPPGCGPVPPGNAGGRFQNTPRPAPGQSTCPVPMNGERFIKASMAGDNIGGLDNLASTFSCMALVGDTGCGFEQHLEAIYAALNPNPDTRVPENAGFLREDAYLAIVILANEDDCSVPATSSLFDTNQTMNRDPLGGLQSFRCNRFGHLCNGAPPPSDPGQLPSGMLDCVSNENAYKDNPAHGLFPVGDYVQFVKSLKDPSKILVALIGGPTKPYRVILQNFQTSTGAMEMQPAVEHSCTAPGAAGTTEYADPSPRLFQFVESFGRNGVFQPICAADFRDSMVRIAEEIGRILGPQCIEGNVLERNDAPGVPDCRVTELRGSGSSRTEADIPHCDDSGAGGTQPLGQASATSPCWRFQNSNACGGGREFQVCYDPACQPSSKPNDTEVTAAVSCAIN